MSVKYHHLVVYDGVCILCNRLIQYLLEKDKQQLLTFSTFQGLPAIIEQNGLQFPFEQSISYFRKGQWWQQSSAVLLLYKDLYGPYHWTQIAWVIPRFMRDFCYRVVAKNRYRWFGKHAHCVLPDSSQKDRFIG